VAAVEKNKVLFAVCHVLRYTDYTQKVKRMVDDGLIGEIVDIQHLEPVGYWHQAHSYVRGHWCKESASSPMLLAKSCHDLDWIRYFMGCRCVEISSFGNLKHFRKVNQPAGAAARCLDCSCESQCPYSAKRFYLNQFRQGNTGWPTQVLTSDLTEAGILKALREGPYGRCVYECDNDVVDHQVVNMLFEKGQTASFTMVGCCEGGGRKTRIFGTRGEIDIDGSVIRRFDFLTEETEVLDTSAPDSSILGGHNGGDYRLMEAFVAAVAANDPDCILSGPKETLESHLMIFAAEEARKCGKVVKS